MAVTARIGPDHISSPTSCIRFSSIFSNKGMDHTLQNWPGSDLDGLVRVWPNASGQVASRCAGIIEPGFWQDAPNPLPVSHFQARFCSSTDVPDNIVQNQPGSDLVLADCVRFWSKRIRSGSGKSRPARFWPMLPSWSGPDANRIRHVYWVQRSKDVGRSGFFLFVF